MKSIVTGLWNSSPADLWRMTCRKIRRAFGSRDQGWDYSLESILQNRKSMNFKMEIERWERLWRLCKLHRLDELRGHFELSGKTVLDVGCGPVLGFGPIALFRGAERFYYQDPHVHREVVEEPAIREVYFRPLHQELVANYGDASPFEQWYAKVMDQSESLPRGIEAVADITVSHSVLEHIPRGDFMPFLRNLWIASRPGGWFAHTVDFGPHGFGDGKMSSLYAMDWEREPERLNLFRASDVASAIRACGFHLVAEVPYKVDEISTSRIHESWRRYSGQDLSCRVVTFIGLRPA